MKQNTKWTQPSVTAAVRTCVDRRDMEDIICIGIPSVDFVLLVRMCMGLDRRLQFIVVGFGDWN